MMEFDMAYHHHVAEKRKKRLIALMMMDSPSELLDNDAASDLAVLRLYLRQYTYIDYKADDWLDKLLYALPVHGLLPRNPSVDDDDIQLLSDIQ